MSEKNVLIRLILATILTVAAGLTLAAIVGVVTPTSELKGTEEPKVYTVQTADAVYTDLTKRGIVDSLGRYTTKTGKRINFYGTFTEIEQ